jgi:pilus assembly protein CpaB
VAIDDLGGSRARRSEARPRRSGLRAAIFWVIALAAGGATAMLLRVYLKANSAATPVLSQVLVAAVDLPVATTLREDHLKLVPWPEGARPPGTFSDAKQAIDRVVLAKLVTGEPILAAKLAAKDAGRGLAALIPPSMRAVAVRVDDVVGVAGFVHPEDRVDVIVTLRAPRSSDQESVSKIILQNVRVLAVGQELDTKDNRQPTSVTVATLLVTPEGSEKLALASTQGKLLLTLRSWTDEQAVETAGVHPTALLQGVEAAPQKPPAEERPAPKKAVRIARAPSEPAPAPAAKDVVEILRGDRFEERKFDAKERQ